MAKGELAIATARKTVEAPAALQTADAPLLFEHDQLVEHIIPDLALVGMLAACEMNAQADE